MASSGLSHEEVWDDSDLLSSWNDALAEYKRFHSIAAKGNKVPTEQLPDGVTRTHEETAGTSATTNEPLQGSGAQAGKVGSKLGMNGIATAASRRPSLSTHGMTVPQNLMNTVQDQSLKNLMMSWYYAGYYTGLYEGQQKGYASAQQDHQDHVQREIDSTLAR